MLPYPLMLEGLPHRTGGYFVWFVSIFLAPRTWELDLKGTQHFPPHPTLNLSLQAPGFLFPPLGSDPVQAQAFWMCALLHSWLTPSLLTPGPLSCPSLFSFSSFLTIPPSLSCHGPVILLAKFSLDPFRCPWPFVLFLIFVVNVLNHTYLRAVMSTCFHSSGAKITVLVSMSAFPRDLAASNQAADLTLLWYVWMICF